MDDVVVFGCGGLGRYVRDVLEQGGVLRPIAFLDSDSSWHGREVDGLRVEGGMSGAAALIRRGGWFVVAIGDNGARVAIATQLRRLGGRLTSAVHPLASVAGSARVGSHVIIGPRAIVCVHATVGDCALLGPGAIVDHDSVVGDGAHIGTAARLAGGVTVDGLATVGVGACVIPGRRVGRGARVLGGSAVVRDVGPGECVAGMPARRVARVEAIEAGVAADEAVLGSAARLTPALPSLTSSQAGARRRRWRA